jgi:hypothetical protein
MAEHSTQNPEAFLVVIDAGLVLNGFIFWVN